MTVNIGGSMSEVAAEVLIIGSGGREQALGDVAAESGLVDRVSFIGGNAGTTGSRLPKGVNVEGVKGNDAIVEYVIENNPDSVWVGPEAPLIDGLVDQLHARGYTRVLGIDSQAAQLEGSKVWADGLMGEMGILRPPAVATTDYSAAIDLIANRHPSDYVIKADKPAGGKGVILPKTFAESCAALGGMLSGELFDGAGKRLQIQDRWHGPEVSVFSVGDGKRHLVLPFFSQDHKRLLNGDEGPNTGGMGAYAPLPGNTLSPRQIERIYESIEKTYEGLERRKIASKGVIYFSFMMAEEAGGDPAMIEYNVRFGDPEAQVVLPALRRAGLDLFEIFDSAAVGELDPSQKPTLSGLGHSALSVCLAAHNYPDDPRKGDEIFGLEASRPDVIIHHGGTKRTEDGRIITSGGRVLYVTGLGDNIDAAAEAAYRAIGKNPDDGGVYFDGMQYRTDIGWQVRSAA